jgi:hypothetical protein
MPQAIELLSRFRLARESGLTRRERNEQLLIGAGLSTDTATAIAKGAADDALLDAKRYLATAIVDLRELGVAVPQSLYKASHALSYIE